MSFGGADEFDLLRVRCFHLRTVVAVEPPADPDPPSCKRPDICGFRPGKEGCPRLFRSEKLNVPLLNCHGEVLSVIVAEIELQPSTHERGGRHPTLDKLEAPGTFQKNRNIGRVADVVEIVRPYA